MTTGEIAYLSLVILAFAAFCATLGWISWRNP